MNKDPDVIPEQASLIILDRKSAVCMSNNGKHTKHARHISILMHFVKNVEDFHLQKVVWFEGGLKLSDIGTNNFRRA